MEKLMKYFGFETIVLQDNSTEEVMKIYNDFLVQEAHEISKIKKEVGY
jgi:hypothetical protein